jgi:leader peptidase (prepilin peptidase) / N-methyltransferase
MSLVQLLASSPAFLIGLCVLGGLMVGSFLNVVIHRLPIMLERQWREQCEEMAAQDAQAATPAPADQAGPPPVPRERYDLAFPGSACPVCRTPIPPLQNIPILSYLALKGRCASCHARIKARYPLVEALAALMSGAVAVRFGFGLPLVAALVFSWFLLALAVLDIEQQLLPDELTYPLLWIGLLLSLWGPAAGGATIPVDPRSAILGAAYGYVSLWSVYHLYRLVTGREGMGHGDFKLLSALGAWLGLNMLLPIILIASVGGAIVGIAMLRSRGQSHTTPIPFGPFLAAAGWLVLMLGRGLLQHALPFLAPFP